ncbi:hypothetical protein OV207_32470 [Corallococcus sp. BB11-1]|uniref:hypothetical protein n=1 Tax=Corallococcus sp. BB11-1 TaxID=2996783 RepID=UPI0022702831|nr:hypothetical protein [Corallococcus sp. BB11-1]MCY1036195.1 hypothetical protein [Corallococcus sp. BB11-1]
MPQPNTTYTVFYAWQSDISPASHGSAFIRNTLQAAIIEVEKLLGDGIRLNLDEATRGEVGSPDIPQTIFRKISECDIFIGDLTTINKDSASGRKVQNPNVLVELGHAAALLGWSRVIMVLNEAFGGPEDLPFDVDRRRASKFKLPPPSGDPNKDASLRSNATGMLSALLRDAMKEILLASPEKPVVVHANPVAIKRERDLRTFRRLLRFLNPDVFDELGRNAPRRLEDWVLDFWSDFDGLWNSSSTHVYDELAKSLLSELHSNWDTLVSHQHYVSGVGDFIVWETPGDMFPSPQSEADFKEANRQVQLVRTRFSEFMAHLRAQYVEIDLDEAKRESWAHHHRVHQQLTSQD